MKRAIAVLCLLIPFVTAAAQQPSSAMPPPRPVRILVAYHSQTGNTEKMAQAIQKGAMAVPGVQVNVQKIEDVKDSTIPEYDGIVVGTPVYWSNLSSDTKRFLERVGAALWTAKTNGDGRTAGAFCTGGEVSMGKDVARLSIISAFLTMRFQVIGGVSDSGFGTLGPEATTGAAGSGVSDKEQEQARRFGERFARLTRQIRSPH